MYTIGLKSFEVLVVIGVTLSTFQERFSQFPTPLRKMCILGRGHLTVFRVLHSLARADKWSWCREKSFEKTTKYGILWLFQEQFFGLSFEKDANHRVPKYMQFEEGACYV